MIVFLVGLFVGTFIYWCNAYVFNESGNNKRFIEQKSRIRK